MRIGTGVDELATAGWTGRFVERTRTASLSDEEESEEELLSEDEEEEDVDEEEDDELDELDESESESELDSLSLSDSAMTTFFTVFPLEGGNGAATGTTGAIDRVGVSTTVFAGTALDGGRMTGVDFLDGDDFSFFFFLVFSTSCTTCFAPLSLFSACFLSRLLVFTVVLVGTATVVADVDLRFFVERSGGCVSSVYVRLS